MMRLALLLLAAAPGLHAADFGKVPLSASFPVRDGNAVIEIQDDSAIGLVGTITPGLVASVRETLRRRPVKTIYIDSPGGDVPSAIVLARLMRASDIRLVIAGLCHSACANYLFIGSTRKDILPGSLVAIHGKRSWYTDRKGLQHDVTGMSKGDLNRLAGNPTTSLQLDRIASAESDFYKEIGYAGDYHRTFFQYEARAAAFGLGKDERKCPQIDYWVLSKADFTQMGIRGLGAAWVPRSEAEAKSAAADLRLNTNRVYFGSLAGINKFCAPLTLTEKIMQMWSGTNPSSS